MSIRDRRLVAMGVMAALGEADTFEIQMRAAIKNGELNEDQIKDLLVFLTQYVGFPRTTRLLAAVRKIFAEQKK
jgi:4-carboxymuconolactone decarboxylase